MVMLASNTGVRAGYLAGRFPGKIGNLYGPGDQKGPFEFMPYSLDNRAFAAWKNKTEWDPDAWVKLLAWARLSGLPPRWVLVPDVVADRIGTLERWKQYAPIAREYGWPLAFAVQDGMDITDVPIEAEVVFVGGSTEWKWATAEKWCRSFPRVHIGRVNSYQRLVQCETWGVESIDGTGWLRGDQKQYRGLLAYLEEAFGHRRRHVQELLEVTA